MTKEEIIKKFPFMLDGHCYGKMGGLYNMFLF